MRKFSFPSSEAFWPAQKLSYHELVCPGRLQNLGEFLLPFFLEDFKMFDEMIMWIILSPACCFVIIKKLGKACSDA